MACHVLAGRPSPGSASGGYQTNNTITGIMSLQLRAAAKCKFDVLSLGECMVRLAPPGHGRIEFAKVLEVDVGGGEFNVAYACARLGLRAGFVSKLPDNPVARIILNHARAAGLDVSNVLLEKFDGVGRAGRVGLNFTEVGTGVRASVTMYDRGHSSISRMRPEEINWEEIFQEQGAVWLHTGGILASLSDQSAAVTKAALQAARAAGTVTSYDLNFRGKFWSSAQGHRRTRDIIPHVQVLIGNEEDFQKALGFEVEGTTARIARTCRWRLTSAWSRAWWSNRTPTSAPSGTTLREVKSGLVNNWGGILWHDGNSARRASSRTWRSRTASAAATAFPAASPMASSRGWPGGDRQFRRGAWGAAANHPGRHFPSDAGGSPARHARAARRASRDDALRLSRPVGQAGGGRQPANVAGKRGDARGNPAAMAGRLLGQGDQITLQTLDLRRAIFAGYRLDGVGRTGAAGCGGR